MPGDVVPATLSAVLFGYALFDLGVENPRRHGDQAKAMKAAQALSFGNRGKLAGRCGCFRCLSEFDASEGHASGSVRSAVAATRATR
jgi:hypothetical protein